MDDIMADSVSNMFQSSSVGNTSYSSYYSSDTYSLGKSDTGMVNTPSALTTITAPLSSTPTQQLVTCSLATSSFEIHA